MLPRTLTQTLKKALRTFPAVVVTGPRQSGKTTLLKGEYGKTHQYLNLENPDVRVRAKEDPVGFLDQITGPVIVDEIQYVPELLSYIKTAIDADRKPGRWLLTGSQNFVLMEGVSQSLAGRASILTLLPLSTGERQGLGDKSDEVEEVLVKRSKTKLNTNLADLILRGSYPEIASNPKVDRNLWCSSYITTYLERDIRNLKQVGDLGQYEIFLRACAARTGQILDLSSISREIGISFTTAKRWLSLLETGYQVLLLRPYYGNVGKRLVKRPKIFFTDTGLATYLLGLNTKENLMAGSYLGPLFETLVVVDFWKRYFHHGQTPMMYYLRTRDGLEIDLVIELAERLTLIEIKSTSTVKPEHAMSLVRAKRDIGEKIKDQIIISNTKESFELGKGITNISFPEILLS